MDDRQQHLPLMDGKEIRIAVPWGFIAAKEYGDPNGIPVLAVHGWLDNCGSFDPLMPYIVPEHNLHVVAIDEPGCGLSSHKPIGSDYDRWSTLKEMKRVIQFMGWKSVTLLGHSQGGHFAFIFGAVYPDLVDRIISIDMVKPLTLRIKHPSFSIAGDIDMYLRYDEKIMKHLKPPVYTEEEAIKKLKEATNYSVNDGSAKILMKRGSKAHEGSIVFNRDIRLRLRGIEPFTSSDVMLDILSNLCCDLLIIKAKGTPSMFRKEEVQKYMNCYEKYCRIFQYIEIDGTHHVHMNDPDLVGPIINEFIGESKSAGPLMHSTKMQSKL